MCVIRRLKVNDTGHCSRKAEKKTFDRLRDRWRDNIKMGPNVIGCLCVYVYVLDLSCSVVLFKIL